MVRPKFALAVGSALVLAAGTSISGLPAVAAPGIAFSTPTVVDPIHTNGEPDIGIDPQGRVFVSGPTGTGTQRSTWFGSVDRGQAFRVISPGPPPSALVGLIDPPGGGDTDINFDRSGKQYFADLYALACLRVATTSDGGATAQQNIDGCGTNPSADRQWLAVYDPPSKTLHESAYRGPTPLVYLEYNNDASGGQWDKSTDGLNYANALTVNQLSAPFGPDGYPAVDQQTGKVFQAAGSDNSLLLNIGTPDASGNLTFLDSTS